MADAESPAKSGPSDSLPVTTAQATDAKTTSENLRVIGGLLALVSGLVALVVIVLVGMQDLAQEQAGAAATGGITAIATMVGAYFGVKVGSDGTKEAVKGQKEEAAKAQAFALAADSSKLGVIQELLNGETNPAEALSTAPATSTRRAPSGDPGF